MDLWLIVPAKPFDQGKSRLADTLLPFERAAVNQNMLTQVLTTASAADVFTGIIVISRSQQVLQHASKLGAVPVREKPDPTNPPPEQRVDSSTLRGSVLDPVTTPPVTMPIAAQPDLHSDTPSCSASSFFARDAAEQHRKTEPSTNGTNSLSSLPKEQSLNNALEQARQAAIARGADAILVLPIDLPLLTIDDVKELYDLGAQQHGIVITRSQDGGTNALLLRPPTAIDFAFGIDSFRRHCELSESAGYPCQNLESATLAFDLDGPEDWKRHQESDQAPLLR